MSCSTGDSIVACGCTLPACSFLCSFSWQHEAWPDLRTRAAAQVLLSSALQPMCDTQLLFAFREQATQGPASTELSAFALRFLTLPQRLVSQPWHRFTLTFVKTNQSSRAAPRCCSLCSYVIFMVQRPAGVHRAGAWMGQGCHRNGAAREKWEEVGEAGRGTLLPTDWVRFPAVWFNCLSSFCVVHGKEALIAGDCRKMLVNCTKWKDFLSQKKSLEEGVEGAGGSRRREDSENWTVHCAESRSRDGLAGKGERRRMGRGQCLASSTQKQKAIFKMYGFGFFFFGRNGREIEDQGYRVWDLEVQPQKRAWA